MPPTCPRQKTCGYIQYALSTASGLIRAPLKHPHWQSLSATACELSTASKQIHAHRKSVTARQKMAMRQCMHAEKKVAACKNAQTVGHVAMPSATQSEPRRLAAAHTTLSRLTRRSSKARSQLCLSCGQRPLRTLPPWKEDRILEQSNARAQPLQKGSVKSLAFPC